MSSDMLFQLSKVITLFIYSIAKNLIEQLDATIFTRAYQALSSRHTRGTYHYNYTLSYKYTISLGLILKVDDLFYQKPNPFILRLGGV